MAEEFDVITLVLILVMLALSFGIGANDETMATVVGSRAIKIKVAVYGGAVLVIIGVLWLAKDVGKTIGENLLSGDMKEYYMSPVTGVIMMLAVIVSTTIWLIVASKTGAPISTTHSVVGAVMGVALIYAIQSGTRFREAMDWKVMGEVALGWVISPLFGFLGAYAFQWVVSKLIHKQKLGLEKLETIEKSFLYLLVAAVSWTQISRGGNDAANALGIMYSLIDSEAISSTLEWPLLIAAGLMLALGLILVGKNVIENVGNNLIEMRPSDAFNIQISTSIVIFLATIFGLPVSGSHILIFAVLGSGRVKGEKPDKKSFRKMLISWVVTFPAAGALAAICYLLFSFIPV